MTGPLNGPESHGGALGVPTPPPGGDPDATDELDGAAVLLSLLEATNQSRAQLRKGRR